MITRCPVCNCEDWKVISRDLYTPSNRYLRCKGCRSAFCSREFKADKIDDHYEKFYECEGSFDNKFFAKASKHLLKISKKYLDRLARFKKSGKLLDLGCGRGEFINIAQQLGRYECVGLDLSSRVATEAKELFGVNVVVGSFNAGLFKDEKFDVVYMRHIIEHVPNPHQFVADIKAVCAPGGVVVAHLPNDLSFTNVFKRFIYPFRILKEYGSLNYPYHIVGYNPNSIKLLFEKFGFTHLETRTFSKLNPLYDFHFSYFDFPALPVIIWDTLPGRGNSIVSYFRLEE